LIVSFIVVNLGRPNPLQNHKKIGPFVGSKPSPPPGGGVFDPCLGIGVPPRVWNPDPV